MRWLVILAVLALTQLGPSPGSAASCTKEDFALAVDRAGAALRKLNADNLPQLRAKMRQLKEARGWPDAGFEEKAYDFRDEALGAEYQTVDVPAEHWAELDAWREKAIEAIAETDDDLMHKFLEGVVPSAAELKAALRKATIVGLGAATCQQFK